MGTSSSKTNIMQICVRDDKGRTALHRAVLNEHAETASFLLAHDAPIEAKDHFGNTALHYAAIIKGSVTLLKLLLVNNAQIDARNNKGETALHRTVLLEKADAASFLLAHDVPIEATDNKEYTALHYAASNGSVMLLKLLLAKNAQMDARNEKGETALHCAVLHEKVDAANFLLAHDAPIEATNNVGHTALHYAASNGSVALLELLLANNAQIDTQNNKRETALHYAVFNEQAEAVKCLLAHDAPIEATNNVGHTALHYAASNGSVALLELLLANNAQVDAPNNKGETALHCAVLHEKVDAVNFLLAHDAPIEATNNVGDKALHYAAYRGSVGLLELLLANNAQIDARNDHGGTALHCAVLNEKVEAASFLLAYDAPLLVDATSHVGNTALYYAAYKGSVGLLELLLSNNAQIDVRNDKGETVLHYAVLHEQAEAVKCLLAHDAPIEATNNVGDTALHAAAIEGSAGLLELLLAKNAQIDARNEDGNTALHLAVLHEKVDAVKCLLAHDAPIEATNNVGNKALHYAAYKGSVVLLELLLASNAQIDARNDHGGTALHCAVLNEKVEAASFLLVHDAPLLVDATSHVGNTALHVAACQDSVALLELLLANHAQINAQNEDGTTALHYAVLSEQAEAANFLLAHDVPIEAVDNAGYMALHYAAINGSVVLLELLLANSAQIDAVDNHGETALHYAVLLEQADAVSCLLAHDAPIEARDHFGNTALHIAAINGSVALLELLLADNAQIDARNEDGETALVLAAKNGHDNIVKMLEIHRANKENQDEHGIAASLRRVVKTLNDFNATKACDAAVIKESAEPQENKKLDSPIEFWLISRCKKILTLSSDSQLDKTKPFNEIRRETYDKNQWKKMQDDCEYHYGISMQHAQENASIQWLAKFIHKKVMQSESMILWRRYTEDHNKQQSGLFFIHPIFGGIGGLDKTAQEINQGILRKHNISMYLYASPLRKLAYESATFDVACKAFCDIEYQAKLAVNAIQAVQPHGPYYLCGWSYGGVLTVEIARQLHERGEKIKHIGLIDPKMPAQLRAYTPEKLLYRISRHLDYICQAMLGEGQKPEWASIRQKVATLGTGEILVDTVFSHVLAQLKTYEDEGKYVSLIKSVKICKANYIATLRYETNKKLKDAKLPPVTVYVAGVTPESWSKQEYSLGDCVDLTEKRIREEIIEEATHVDIVEDPKFIKLLNHYLENADTIEQVNKLSQAVDKCYRKASFSQCQMGDNDTFFELSECEVAQCCSRDGSDIDTFLSGNAVQQALLRGSAGAGKSLLARKLVLNNREGKTSRQKRWVFYIPMHAILSYTRESAHPLRESNYIECLLYHHYGKLSGMCYEQVKCAWDFIKQKPENICFILDKPSDVITDKTLQPILTFLFNQDFSLLVVNRDYQLNLLRDLDFSASVTFTMQLLDDDQVRRLIRQYFKKLEQVSDGDALLMWLQDYPALQHFCKTPLHLSMLCSIWSQLNDESCHDDISCVFEKIVNKMIRRYWENEGVQEQWVANESTQHKIQDDIKDELQFLQYIAYHNLIDTNSTITPQQMSEWLWLETFRDKQSLFMKALRTGFIVPLAYAAKDIERCCEFNNPSIQLYLACQYFYQELTTLSHEKIKSIPGKDLWHFVQHLIEQYPLDLLRAFMVTTKSEMLTGFLYLLNCQADNIYSLPLLFLISHSLEASYNIGGTNCERDSLVKRISTVFYYASSPFSQTYSVSDQRDTPDVATKQLDDYKNQVNALAEQCPRLTAAIKHYIDVEKNTAKENNNASAYDYKPGENGLHFAVKIQNKVFLAELLTLGADTEKRCDEGNSPIKVAYDNQFVEGAALISQHVKSTRQQRLDASVKQLCHTYHFCKTKASMAGQSIGWKQRSKKLLSYLGTLIKECDKENNAEDALCQRIRVVREEVMQQYLLGQKTQCLEGNNIDKYLFNLLKDYQAVDAGEANVRVPQIMNFFEVHTRLSDKGKGLMITELMVCLKNKDVGLDATVALIKTNQCDTFKQHLHEVYIRIKSTLYKEYRTVHDGFKAKVADVFSEDEYCQFLDNAIAKLSRGDLTDQGLAHDVKALVKNKLAPLLCENTAFVNQLFQEKKSLLLRCLLKRYREKARSGNSQAELTDGLEKLLRFAYSQCYGKEIKQEITQIIIDQCKTSKEDNLSNDDSMMALLKKSYADFNSKGKREEKGSMPNRAGNEGKSSSNNTRYSDDRINTLLTRYQTSSKDNLNKDKSMMALLKKS